MAAARAARPQAAPWQGRQRARRRRQRCADGGGAAGGGVPQTDVWQWARPPESPPTLKSPMTRGICLLATGPMSLIPCHWHCIIDRV
eukprot:165358-Chlamydomonas_euryale.AAC.1